MNRPRNQARPPRFERGTHGLEGRDGTGEIATESGAVSVECPDLASLRAALAALPPPDPDPVVRLEMNAATWETIRASVSAAPTTLVVPPFVGLPVRIAPWPDGVVRKVRRSADA